MQRKNYKYRRMVERLPEQMQDLMANLDHECFIQKHHAGTWGWSVAFLIESTEMMMRYDRGAIWIEKDPKGENTSFAPLKKRWWNSPIRDLAKQLNQEFAQAHPKPNPSGPVY